MQSSGSEGTTASREDLLKSSTAPTQDGYSTLVARVGGLLGQDEDLDGPTPFAMQAAYLLLTDTLIHESRLPRGSVAATIDGGIDIHWRNGARVLKLSLPAEAAGTGYIYHQDEQEHAAELSATPQALAKWIRWLNGAE